VLTVAACVLNVGILFLNTSIHVAISTGWLASLQMVESTRDYEGTAVAATLLQCYATANWQEHEFNLLEFS
jgi:hypothetical protein